MSTTSRLRERTRDKLLGRTQPDSMKSDLVAPKPYGFSITEWAKTLFGLSEKQKAKRRELRARAEFHDAKNREIAHFNRPESEWLQVPWRRDGFKSALHYIVHHERPSLMKALHEGPGHPMFAAALTAQRANLL